MEWTLDNGVVALVSAIAGAGSPQDQGGKGRAPTGDRQKELSNTVIDLEISSSLLQHSKNSSNVTTPSLLTSIFYRKFTTNLITYTIS